MKSLETTRLLLREFRETDLEDFYEYAKNPKVGPRAGWPPHKTVEETLGILNRFMEGNEVWALVDKKSNKLIGSLGLHEDRYRSVKDVRMLGFVLSEDYWGQGIMAEAAKAAIRYAFENLNITLLTIHHYTFNEQSKRVIEKCGFVYEGILRHAAQIYDNSVYDVACYSMTKEEWNNTL
ncbi:MAG: hypothetical protein K0S01_1862 [Herbinix sp.]|jgi:putative acetyltransferase|nr:hypothetical protein [Herbinix sp.]